MGDFDTFSTKVGGAFIGERAVFRGHDIHKELMGLGWLGLFAFGATGRQLTAEQIKLFDSIFLMTSYPDARIWNNRIAGLVGTTRGTPATALAAAAAISEATIYGRLNEVRAIGFFTRTRQFMERGVSLEDCLAHQMDREGLFPGYGRPLAPNDERIAPCMELAKFLGLDQGPHIKLAFQIHDHIFKTKGLKINFGAVVSAFGADFGMSQTEFNLFMFNAFTAGMVPCYLEGLEKPAGSVFAATVDDVSYNGVKKRKWS